MMPCKFTPAGALIFWVSQGDVYTYHPVIPIIPFNQKNTSPQSVFEQAISSSNCLALLDCACYPLSIIIVHMVFCGQVGITMPFL